jgi:hypothetical protein
VKFKIAFSFRFAGYNLQTFEGYVEFVSGYIIKTQIIYSTHFYILTVNPLKPSG